MTQYDTQMETSEPRVMTIDNRCDAIEGLVGQAHQVLTELESRISPILQQEAPEKDSNVVKPSSVSDSSAVISQRLATIEYQTKALIERIHMLTLRSEV